MFSLEYTTELCYKVFCMLVFFMFHAYIVLLFDHHSWIWTEGKLEKLRGHGKRREEDMKEERRREDKYLTVEETKADTKKGGWLFVGYFSRQ